MEETRTLSLNGQNSSDHEESKNSVENESNSNGTKTIHIDGQNPQNSKQQNGQQGKRPDNGNQKNGGNNSRGGNNQGKDTSVVNGNRLGLTPTGQIFTFSTSQINSYFEKWFAAHGYAGIRFVNSRPNSDKLTDMYFVFPKNKSLTTNGKSPNEIEAELLGGKARGAHIRLNGELFELIKKFLRPDDRSVHIARENPQYCYVRLDTAAVLFYLFDEEHYDVFLIDTLHEGRTEVLYRIGQCKKASSNVHDIEEIVQNLSRASY